jgi:hypothetical protein
VQFTLVFPILMLIVLGTVDASLMFFSYAGGYKATYAGARFAAVSAPVAQSNNVKLLDPTPGSKAGLSCFDAGGNPDATANCTSWTLVCTGGAGNGGTCTGCSPNCFNNTAFTDILNKMQSYYLYRTLDRRQVTVSYQSTGLGYVSRPGGSPMTVTVSLRCMKHELFFLGPLMGWAFPALPAACNGIPTNSGIPMPTFSTTLPSEDMTTN